MNFVKLGASEIEMQLRDVENQEDGGSVREKREREAAAGLKAMDQVV